MTSKSQLATLLLLASILLLVAPAVQGCVNFEACYYRGPGQNPNHASIVLYDNNGVTPVCLLDGYASRDGLFHLNCIAGYSATWDPNTFITSYTPAGRQTYTFQNSTPDQASGVCSASCDFGCSAADCFVNGPNQ